MGAPAFPGENRLFRNRGGFRFEDVTDTAGVGQLARDSFTAIFADFDGNGWPDLHVAVDHTSDEFFLNDGGQFRRATNVAGANHRGNDMGVAVGDIDNDGDLDMYSTNITDPDFQFGTDQGNALYVNQRAERGFFRFFDEAWIRGAADTAWGWGVEFVDLEHDGDLDGIAATGFDEYIRTFPGAESLLETPIVAMINAGPGLFERTVIDGLERRDDSRALIAFDYDRDGDEDLLVTNVAGPARLYRNDSPRAFGDRSSWLEVSLIQAPGGNSQGIGATVTAQVGDRTYRRDVLAAESYLAGTPSEVHFGLRDGERVDLLTVRWTDGTVSEYRDLPPDRHVRIYQRPGDADRDGDVDRRDARRFRQCFRHQGSLGWECHAFDFDLNGAIDPVDAAAMSDALSEPIVEPEENPAERPRIRRGA